MITANYSGPLNVDDLIECISHLFNDPEFHMEYNGVSDFRNASLDMGYDDLNKFRSWLERQKSKSVGRWAVLVSRTVDFGTLRCWEVLSEGYHEELRVFREEEEAIAWLGR